MSSNQFKLTFLAVALACALAMGTAHAQTAAAPMAGDATAAATDAGDAALTKAKAKKPKKAAAKAKKLPFVTVTVTNNRTVGLVQLDAVITGSGGDSVKLVGALGEGKKAVAHVAHDKDCLFDLHGTYADGATLDETSVDLCKDRKINLVD